MTTTTPTTPDTRYDLTMAGRAALEVGHAPRYQITAPGARVIPAISLEVAELTGRVLLRHPTIDAVQIRGARATFVLRHHHELGLVLELLEVQP